ncbi:MAG: hypothetical protein ABI324_21600 [Ktedonobacteraceae bacterium]
MTQTVTPVKGTYEYLGRTSQSYWNGKTYGSTVYVSITSSTGKPYKVSYDVAAECVKEWSNQLSLDEAKSALQSVGIIG